MSELIEFQRDAETVRVKVESGAAGGGQVFAFLFSAGAEWAANLLISHLRERMWNRLEAIRKEAYLQGWKDAKAHAKKQTWFSSRWA